MKNDQSAELVAVSKFLSYVLRHRPDAIGLELDERGWVSVDELIRRANAHGRSLTRELLEEVVRLNDKKRFAFNEERTLLRASQGHSIDVELGLEPVVPPQILFHGTATRFLEGIRREGLKPMNRTHVHLSADIDTAVVVGKRHGVSALLSIASGAMHDEGTPFYLSANGVWLVERVPVHHITFPEKGDRRAG